MDFKLPVFVGVVKGISWLLLLLLRRLLPPCFPMILLPHRLPDWWVGGVRVAYQR